jgi:hypothetical protein
MTVLALTVAFCFAFQWYVLRYLPVVDCLPYKVGSNIPEKMKIPAGAIQDSSVISFVYEKDGKQLEFTAEQFPADFDDTRYHFVRRYDKLIRQGNAVVAIKDFALGTISGNDTTQAILNTPGHRLLIFTKGFSDSPPAWLKDLQGIFKTAASRNIAINFITNDYDNVTNWLSKAGLPANTAVLKCDFVAIKTAARANPTLYLLDQGTIRGKWSYAEFDKALAYIASVK